MAPVPLSINRLFSLLLPAAASILPVKVMSLPVGLLLTVERETFGASTLKLPL